MAKTYQELYIHFRDLMLPKLTELEAMRRKLIDLYAICLAVPGAGLFVFWLWAFTTGFCSQADGFKTLLWISVVIVAGSGVFVSWHFRSTDFYALFKKYVIEELIKFISADVQYEQKGYVSRHQFVASALFTTNDEEYRGDDRFFGTLDKTSFEASELHVAYYVRTKNGRRRVPIFDGMFFVADFNKNLHGSTKVEPDVAESILGIFGTSLQKMTAGDRFVKMEDPTFEKFFKVTSTDQIEARYILTPAMMQRIVEFKEKAKADVRLSFLGQKVYIAVSHSGALFEPNVFSSLLDFAPIRGYYADIALALGIIEDLDLNTRIWTKE